MKKDSQIALRLLGSLLLQVHWEREGTVFALSLEHARGSPGQPALNTQPAPLHATVTLPVPHLRRQP